MRRSSRTGERADGGDPPAAVSAGDAARIIAHLELALAYADRAGLLLVGAKIDDALNCVCRATRETTEDRA